MNKATNRLLGTGDPTFGENGIVSLPFKGVTGSIPNALMLRPTKQLLVALRTAVPESSPAKIACLNDDGSRDFSFGHEGIVEIPFPESTHFVPGGLRSVANGGWVITGTAIHPTRGEELAVVRQLEDGQLDASFGENGIVLLNVSRLLGTQEGVGFQFMTTGNRQDVTQSNPVEGGGGDCSSYCHADGKILLVSTISYGFDDLQGIVIRLNKDGSLDKSFNDAGYVLIELPEVERRTSHAHSVAAQEDGKVLVCGSFSRQGDIGLNGFVIRYDHSGRIDAEFGDDRNGVVKITDGEGFISLNAVNVVSGTEGFNGIILTGGTGDTGVIVVLTPSGSFNSVFNNGRALYTSLGRSESWARAILQGNQEGNAEGIVVFGIGVNTSQRSAMLISRYLLDGRLDKTFGMDGIIEIGGENNIFPLGFFLQGNNKIVVSGYVIFQPLTGWVQRLLV